jgi:hypothetical protein
MKQTRRNKRNKMKYTYRKKRTRKRTLKRKRTRKRGGAFIKTNASIIFSNVPPNRIQREGDTTQITQGATTSENTLLSSLTEQYPVPVPAHQGWLEDIKRSHPRTFRGRTGMVTYLEKKKLGYISAHGNTVLYKNGEPKYTIIPDNINIIFYGEGGGNNVKAFPDPEEDVNMFSYYRGGALCEEYRLKFYPGYQGTGTYSKKGVYDNTKDIMLLSDNPDDILKAIIQSYNSEGWSSSKEKDYPKALMEGLEEEYGAENLEAGRGDWLEQTREFNGLTYEELNERLLKYFYEDKWSIINMTGEERRPTLSSDDQEKLEKIISHNDTLSSHNAEKRKNPEFTWNGPVRNFSDILKLLSKKKKDDPSLPDVYVCMFCRGGVGFIDGMDLGVEVAVGMEPLSKCGELFKDHRLGLDVSGLPLLSQREPSLPGELRRDSSLASSNALNYFREILDELIEYGNENTTSWLVKLNEINEKNSGINRPSDRFYNFCLDREEVCFVLQLRHTLSLRHVP